MPSQFNTLLRGAVMRLFSWLDAEYGVKISDKSLWKK